MLAILNFAIQKSYQKRKLLSNCYHGNLRTKQDENSLLYKSAIFFGKRYTKMLPTGEFAITMIAKGEVTRKIFFVFLFKFFDMFLYEDF
mgnify:CR=1 FL=1